jgi:hypothetical protein
MEESTNVVTQNLNKASGLMTKLAEQMQPLNEKAEKTLENAEKVTKPLTENALFFSIGFAVVDFFVILIYFVLIVIYIINPKSGFGIPISRNVYSIFYLTTTLVLSFLVVGYGNPILDNIEQSPDSDKTSKSEQLIDKLFSYFNKIISISVVPVIILETIFLVLLVFIISFMFIISTSMVRTYFALQCNYGQMIRASWWAYIIDVIMYCLLFISFIIWCILQFLSAFTDAPVKRSRLLFRRVFLITFAYYILKIIFLALEYGISNNIVAISKWNQETNECLDKTESPPGKPENIFYLFLNIMLCICIWLLILLFIGGHLYVGIYLSPYISKANIVVKIITDLFLFIFSGKMSQKSVTKKIESFTTTISKIIPGISDKLPDVIGIVKTQVEKILEKTPNMDVGDFVNQVIEKGLASMNSGSFDIPVSDDTSKEKQPPLVPTDPTTHGKALVDKTREQVANVLGKAVPLGQVTSLLGKATERAKSLPTKLVAQTTDTL